MAENSDCTTSSSYVLLFFNLSLSFFPRRGEQTFFLNDEIALNRHWEILHFASWEITYPKGWRLAFKAWKQDNLVLILRHCHKPSPDIWIINWSLRGFKRGGMMQILSAPSFSHSGTLFSSSDRENDIFKWSKKYYVRPNANKNTTTLRTHSLTLLLSTSSSFKFPALFARGARVMNCYFPSTIATLDRTFDRHSSIAYLWSFGIQRGGNKPINIGRLVLGTTNKVWKQIWRIKQGVKDWANLPFGTFSLRGAFHTAHARIENTEKTHLLSYSVVLRTVMYFKVLERLTVFWWYR